MIRAGHGSDQTCTWPLQEQPSTHKTIYFGLPLHHSPKLFFLQSTVAGTVLGVVEWLNMAFAMGSCYNLASVCTKNLGASA